MYLTKAPISGDYNPKCPACDRKTLLPGELMCRECDEDIERDPLPDIGKLDIVRRLRDHQPAHDPEDLGALPGEVDRDDLYSVPVDLILTRL